MRRECVRENCEYKRRASNVLTIGSRSKRAHRRSIILVRAQEPIRFSPVFLFRSLTMWQLRRTRFSLCAVCVISCSMRMDFKEEEEEEENTHFGSSRHSYLKAETDSIRGGGFMLSVGLVISYRQRHCHCRRVSLHLFEQSVDSIWRYQFSIEMTNIIKVRNVIRNKQTKPSVHFEFHYRTQTCWGSTTVKHIHHK